MKVLLTLDKENMQNIDERMRKKKKKISYAVTTILNVIDVHIEKWEDEPLKHKTQMKTQDKTHGKPDGKTQEITQEETQEKLQAQENTDTIDFVKVKKRVFGRETFQAIVNGVRFYCVLTDKDTGKKYFRCSFYHSENCTARFQAMKIDNDKWEATDLKNATWHIHENATTEDIILKAKLALKQEVLDSAINKRRKDIYFDFIQR